MALTREQALEAYASKESASVVAKRLGVDEGTVRKIRLKKRWKAETDAYDAAGGDDQGEAISGDDECGQAGVAGTVAGSEDAGGSVGGDVGKDVAPERHQGHDGGASGAGVEGHGGDLAEDAPVVGVLRTCPVLDEAGTVTAAVIEPGQFISTPYPEPAPPDPHTAPDGRRDLFPATLPPKPGPPVCPKGLEARFVRVLLAAKLYGVVRSLRGYGGKSLIDTKQLRAQLLAEGKMEPEAIEAAVEDVERINEAFVPSPALTRQMRLGLIEPGEHANTFVLTKAGEERLAEYDAYLTVHDEYLHKLALWRREVRRKASAEGELVGDVA